jgi:hypothetical protein
MLAKAMNFLTKNEYNKKPGLDLVKDTNELDMPLLDSTLNTYVHGIVHGIKHDIDQAIDQAIMSELKELDDMAKAHSTLWNANQDEKQLTDILEIIQDLPNKVLAIKKQRDEYKAYGDVIYKQFCNIQLQNKAILKSRSEMREDNERLTALNTKLENDNKTYEADSIVRVQITALHLKEITKLTDQCDIFRLQNELLSKKVEDYEKTLLLLSKIVQIN